MKSDVNVQINNNLNFWNNWKDNEFNDNSWKIKILMKKIKIIFVKLSVNIFIRIMIVNLFLA